MTSRFQVYDLANVDASWSGFIDTTLLGFLDTLALPFLANIRLELG